MSLFAPKWLRFHHRICDRYEQIAFPLAIESGKDLANPTIIAGRILAEELKLQPAEGAHLALQLYEEFQKLEVGDIMKKELMAKPGLIPTDSDINELLGIMRRRFHIESHWHVYYLNFVISDLLVKKNLGIERGDYLMRIALGTVPDEKGITKLLKRTLRFAGFIAHEEKKKAQSGTIADTSFGDESSGTRATAGVGADPCECAAKKHPMVDPERAFFILQTLAITSWDTACTQFPFVADLGRHSRSDLGQKYDFYLIVAGLWLILFEKDCSLENSESLDELRRIAQKWDPDVPRALLDLTNFEAMFQGQPRREIVGAWIVWNLKRNKPESSEEFRAAKGFGEMMGKVVDQIRAG